MNNVPTSYLLWLFWLAGCAGIHRIYNKKYVSGLFWLCTWGVFGIGQLVDLFLIPDMVEQHNWKMRKRLGMTGAENYLAGGFQSPNQVYNPSVHPPVLEVNSQTVQPGNKSLSNEDIMVKLAQAASNHGGKLSVTRAVIDTGLTFEQVERVLQIMLEKGYVVIGNDPIKGHIVYDFMDIS
ncbi:TM2 domain-containing protein [Cyanobacterium stanieri LEGE 03274]|uniref:TM2 domain-containing protein n=1 Tax=Cyanobacterium stanieri LEGE 03274 TaxID=1828756 RepID=A0ABR9V364_9CHRO|nr:TM2 domain-containing protein [Cyanobacterium stanieri]MBE9222340.1 TM2 domain-containing protein [Cyanobacterium stanieri LEGE 03274]